MKENSTVGRQGLKSVEISSLKYSTLSGAASTGRTLGGTVPRTQLTLSLKEQRLEKYTKTQTHQAETNSNEEHRVTETTEETRRRAVLSASLELPLEE